MADYHGFARSSYFFVKDKKMFADFCATWNLELFLGQGKHRGKVGFVVNDDLWGLPSGYYDENGDYVEDNILQSLAPHLRDGQIAIVIEAGHDAHRYAFGGAWAVRSDGETREILLQNITKIAARELGGKYGKDFTDPEY